MKNLILLIAILLVVSCGKGKEAQTKTKVTEDNNTKPIKVTDDNATKSVKADDDNATKLTAEEQKVVGEYENEPMLGRPTSAEEQKVVGEYEFKTDEDTVRLVLLENGIWEGYVNGKKSKGDCKWSISKDGELHIIGKDGDGGVYRINKDGSMTIIADTYKDGKREDVPKENQRTFKKIK